MSAPRRYRLALRAYPARYRTGRADELLSTLADGDDERGGASTREALALAYRGLLERGRIAISGDGLLAMAAGLIVVAMLFRLSWGDSVIRFDRGSITGWNMGPGMWGEAALLASACTILAAGPGRAVDDGRRRKLAAWAVFFVALIAWGGPAGIFKYVLPGPGELAVYVWTNLTGIASEWQTSIPFAGATAAVTWLALTGISHLTAPARRIALAAGMASTGVLAIVLTLAQSGPPPIDGHEAITSLGTAPFVTGASILLALAASGRRTTRQL
jgi:hypothetical protein